MAAKKPSSQAEKRVSSTKKKTPQTSKSSPKKQAKPPKPVKKNPKVTTEYESVLPTSTLVAIFSLLLFVLFVILAIRPEGALLQAVKMVVKGLIGPAGFYFSIPALLYLFVIHAFYRKNQALMRSLCLLAFVLLAGSVYHLAVQRVDMSSTGLMVVVDLFRGGATGATGGVICGGIAMLLRWSCGTVVSYILTIGGGIFALLGSFQITIPSLIRAIANRPRADWEEDEEDYIEPAAIVVNHIANKQIAYKRQQRERAIQAAQQADLPQPPMHAHPPVQQERRVEQPAEPAAEIPVDQVKHAPGKGASFMDRIDVEISAPLAGTSEFIQEPTPDVYQEPVSRMPPERMQPEAVDPVIPAQMPELNVNHPIPPAPKLEQPVRQRQEEPKPEKAKPQDTAQQVAREIALAQSAPQSEYRYPPLELLRQAGRGGVDGTEEMRENSRRLNETLASFRIDAHIINVTRGPSVTRYEVELDKGVRLNKLTSCADDIALSLGASGVRIAAVPGKISVVGIEVPNRVVTTVSLREVIDSPEFARAKSKSSFAVGKDIGGNCIIGNIAKMPHLLIAGTTGSGKSVCMNSIIISLLYKAAPEDVKLIMVDPKMVELGIYNGIPHLLIPVVTDPKKAAGSLQWAVTEMLRRYKLMSDAGVRDLESYNSIAEAEEDGQKMPQVVIIIDELADMMMVAAKEVEDSICRIAQMGRAAGMHLIIATQRPSADVITGLMKANIPSRIAFSVASSMESRIILDTMGAEKLVGKGDMLFAPIGCGKPLRVQGCFVTDAEVEAVAEYVKENSTADYNQEVLEEIERKAMQAGKKSAADAAPSDEELEGDEMLPAAVDVILETGQASVSMLQRRLKLGYARAARIVDEMEEKGIVGPFQGSKPRTILITKEQWQARQDGQMMHAVFDETEE